MAATPAPAERALPHPRNQPSRSPGRNLMVEEVRKARLDERCGAH